MLNRTTRTQKLMQIGMTLALGATLFLSGSARAAEPYPESPPPAAEPYPESPPPAAEPYPDPQPPKDDYRNCTEFKQVYAYTEFSKDAYQQLDVFCDEGYRAISCEADISGQKDYDYNKYYISLNKLAPQGFKKNTQGKYEYTDSDATYWGCRVAANNNLRYFTPSHHPQYGYDFSWRITGFATCVPKDCVEVYQAYDYYDEYYNPIDY